MTESKLVRLSIHGRGSLSERLRDSVPMDYRIQTNRDCLCFSNGSAEQLILPEIAIVSPVNFLGFRMRRECYAGLKEVVQIHSGTEFLIYSMNDGEELDKERRHFIGNHENVHYLPDKTNGRHEKFEDLIRNIIPYVARG